jgi:FkbM family methyltransferase
MILLRSKKSPEIELLKIDTEGNELAVLRGGTNALAQGRIRAIHKGWARINVDAMPGSMQAFKKVRPRDINLEFGVGTKEGERDYYLFNEPALNGFSKELSERRHVAETPYKIVEVVKVNVKPLSKILEKYIPSKQVIDFLNIDVEGLDLDVLRSNDWQRYRPKLVLIEVLGNSLRELGGSEIGKFMEGLNYSVYAKCMNTVFFKDNSRGFQS